MYAWEKDLVSDEVSKIVLVAYWYSITELCF